MSTSQISSVVITMAELPTYLKNSYRTLNPIFLHGAPGIGKSDGVHAFCKAMKDKGLFASEHPIDLRLSQHDLTDFKFPLVNRENEKLRWIVADIFPREERDGPAGLLFLDELSSAPLQIQTLAYSLLLDRKIPSTNYKLPPGWLVVAAGNRDTDQAVVHPLSSALCNRISHIEIGVDWHSFKAWAEANSLAEEVLLFLAQYHGDYLHKYKRGQKAYPTPRTWHKFSDALKALKEDKAAQHLVRNICMSWVGIEAGTAFSSFYEQISQVPAADLLLSKKAKFPSGADKLGLAFLAGRGIAELVRHQPAKYAHQFLELLLTDLHEEVAVNTLRQVLTNTESNPEILKAFQKDAKLFKQVSERYRVGVQELSL